MVSLFLSCCVFLEEVFFAIIYDTVPGYHDQMKIEH